MEKDDSQISVLWDGTSCGASLNITLFLIHVTRETRKRVVAVDLGRLNTAAVPCGSVVMTFSDGCCGSQRVELSAVYSEEAGTTTMSCADAG